MGAETYEGTYTIVGPPGTGKTTFLARQVRQIVSRWEAERPPYGSAVMICSLTRAAAREIADRDLGTFVENSWTRARPESDSTSRARGNRGEDSKIVRVGTLHSHCYRMLGRPEIATAGHAHMWNSENLGLHLPPLEFPRDRRSAAQAESEADLEDLAPSSERSGVSDANRDGHDFLARYELLRHRQTPREKWPESLRETSEAWEAFLVREEALDFTGLIERALAVPQPPPGRPWVILVDEAQDLSSLEQALVKKWANYAGATMFVGDPAQSIYGFRGSSPEIFTDPSIPSSRRRVLKQSYRVPERIQAASVDWLEGMSTGGQTVAEYRPLAGEFKGRVELRNETLKTIRGLLGELEQHLRDGRSVMIQASCGYQLHSALAQLREWGIPFSNPWRPQDGSWNPLPIETDSKRVRTADRMEAFICPAEGSTAPREWTWRDVHTWLPPLTWKSGAYTDRSLKGMAKKWVDNDRGDEIFPAEDYFDQFDPFVQKVWSCEVGEAVAAEWWAARCGKASSKVAEYLVRLVEGFGGDALRQAPRCYVGTIHSFKGGEADVVYLFPDLSPKSTRAWADQGEDHDEIVRQFYVAMTRARHTLVICRHTDRGQCVPLHRHVGKFA